MITTLVPSGAATSSPGRAHRPAPRAASAVPPGRTVPAFAAIRRGGRHRPGLPVTGLLVTGLLAAAIALVAGPPRSDPPAPISAPASTPSTAHWAIHP